MGVNLAASSLNVSVGQRQRLTAKVMDKPLLHSSARQVWQESSSTTLPFHLLSS